MCELNIIKAAPNDIEELVKLRVLQQKEDWGDEYILLDNFQERTKKFLEEHLNEDLYIFCVKDKGSIIATCGLQILSLLPQCNDNGATGFICMSYTDPVYRNKGIQKSLIKYSVDFAKEQKFCEVQLETDNKYMESLCKKLGFRDNDLSKVLDLKIEYKTFKEWAKYKVHKI